MDTGRLLFSTRKHEMGNKAIIWDFDGTLADTRKKNFRITKRIMHHLLGERSGSYAALQSLERYVDATRRARNWRVLYESEFGMADALIDQAGRLWTEFQLSDNEESELFDGLEDAIRDLSQYPQLIFSQNSKSNIASVMEKKNLLGHFTDIVGYEELSSRKQKPAPDGLLLCLRRIDSHHCERIFFIGDHETDTLCGSYANAELSKSSSNTRIINVAAFYGSEDDSHLWKIKPDLRVTDSRSIRDCIERY